MNEEKKKIEDDAEKKKALEYFLIVLSEILKKYGKEINDIKD